MAHLALTLDPDACRREQFLHVARQRLETIANLSVRSLEVGQLIVVWGSNPAAPSSVTSQGEQLALLLGYAVDDDGQWLTAAQLANRHALSDKLSAVGDGYYAAVSYSPDRGLRISVDPLGIFPWYWSTPSGVLVGATSGELIAAHPLVELQLDRQGLAGIFLTNGLLNHQSLFCNVYRMRPGHCLLATPGKMAVQQQEYGFTRDDSLQELPFDEACQVVSHEMKRAIARHRPRQGQSALLLSGGMDSRLMAGYLQQANATDAAVCFGWPHDYEARAASQVGTVLKLQVHLDSYEPGDDDSCSLALEMARWSHLSGGFGSVYDWGNHSGTYRKPEYFWSGYLLDEVVGGLAVETGYDANLGLWSFERFMDRLNQWGLPRSTIEPLLRLPDHSAILDTIVSQWRSDYERSDWLPAQQAFSAKLKTRSRFHIGGHFHRLSFQSWPLLPMLDRRLLHVLFNLNPQWLLKRRLETELLRSEFPQLSEIPFDTNSFRFFPREVKSGVKEASRLLQVQRWLQKNSQRLYWKSWRKAEPRRYHRLYDPNSRQWLPIRALAEEQRSQVHTFMDRRIVDRLLPGPRTRIHFRDPFAEGASRRLLIGLMLWHAADHAS